jgi:Ion channel
MLVPLTVATALLFSSLLTYGLAMHFIVRVVVALFRNGATGLGFWKSTAVMGVVTLIMAAAHVSQIALWAVALRLCGQMATWEVAFYFSAQNYTALGYGDVRPSEPWRLLGPLEAINGLLFFGLSTAVLFAVLSHLIADRLRAEIGHRGGGAHQEPFSMVGGVWSKRAEESVSGGRESTAEDAS